MNRTPLYLVGAIVLILSLGLLAWRSHRTITGRIPDPIMCRDEADARSRAGVGAIPVLGTGSMRPFIPAAPAGLDPRRTVVAYVALRPGARFADIRPGDLCLYSPEWHAGFVLHVAAQLDRLGWIMSGVANARSESYWRITAANFKGIVENIYIWPLAP